MKYRLSQRDDFVFPMTLYQWNTLHVDKTRSNEFKLLRAWPRGGEMDGVDAVDVPRPSGAGTRHG